jgi:hypothetical protein
MSAPVVKSRGIPITLETLGNEDRIRNADRRWAKMARAARKGK